MVVFQRQGKLLRLRPVDVWWAATTTARYGPPPSVRAEEGVQPTDGAAIIIPPPTNIAFPGWKIGNRYQFFVQPGEVCQVFQVVNTRVTFRTGGSDLPRLLGLFGF